MAKRVRLFACQWENAHAMMLIDDFSESMVSLQLTAEMNYFRDHHQITSPSQYVHLLYHSVTYMFSLFLNVIYRHTMPSNLSVLGSLWC